MAQQKTTRKTAKKKSASKKKSAKKNEEITFPQSSVRRFAGAAGVQRIASDVTLVGVKHMEKYMNDILAIASKYEF